MRECANIISKRERKNVTTLFLKGERENVTLFKEVYVRASENVTTLFKKERYSERERECNII